MSKKMADRRRWFEDYSNRLDEGTDKPPQVGERHTCPCCRYPTLQARGANEICILCNWEDEGQDDPQADEVWGGPNGPYSLSAARANFDRYLVMYSPDRPDPRVGGEDSLDEKNAKHGMVQAFDAMVGETDPAALEPLWGQVFENERMLVCQLLGRIGKYQDQTDE